MNIKTGTVPSAQKVVVYGPEGIGKTTFAAEFPDPLFIDTEGGTKHLDVRRADPSPTSWEMLLGYVREVAADPSLCATLVIDTADWAEQLCIAHVCAKQGINGIEALNYGKGYVYVKEEFGKLLNLLQDVVERGVNVVVCAHSQIRKFEQPDEMGAYDRWELKLSKQTAPLVKEWADMLLFASYKTIVTVQDNGKGKAQGAQRVMRTEHAAAWDAKNRCGLPAEAGLDYSAIAAHIPTRQAAAPAPRPAAAEPQAAEAPKPVRTIVYNQDGSVASQTTPPAPEPAPPAQATPAEPEHLKPLRGLMASSGVNDAQLQDACGQMGFCTSETPVAVYPADFAAYLAASWPDVLAKIDERRPYTDSIPF